SSAFTRGMLSSALWKKAAPTPTPNELPRIARRTGASVGLETFGEITVDNVRIGPRAARSKRLGLAEAQIARSGRRPTRHPRLPPARRRTPFALALLP